MNRIFLTCLIFSALPVEARERSTPRSEERAEARAIVREEAWRANRQSVYERLYGPGGAEAVRSYPMMPGGRGTMAVPNR